MNLVSPWAKYKNTNIGYPMILEAPVLPNGFGGTETWAEQIPRPYARAETTPSRANQKPRVPGTPENARALTGALIG